MDRRNLVIPTAGLEEWTYDKKNSPINKAILFGPQGAQASQSWRKSTLNIHWKDWCWSWSSNILATWCKESTHWKRPWCWGRLSAGGEGDVRGQDGWMASLTQRTWVWANSGRWWRTGNLVCCSPGARKESDTTERLNSNSVRLWKIQHPQATDIF